MIVVLHCVAASLSETATIDWIGQAIDIRTAFAETPARLMLMDTNNPITAEAFLAFLKCPTKGYLLAIGEAAPTAFFTNVENGISSMYKLAVTPALHESTHVTAYLNFDDMWSGSDQEAISRPVDCETTTYNALPPSHEPGGCQSRKSMPSSTFVPVLFSPWHKPDLPSSLLVCFGALALLQVSGILAATGTIIYGAGYRRKTVKIADHTARTRQVIDAIVAIRDSGQPPLLILNRHCAV